jgi:acyl-CoA synthetase (NDP forming)
MGFYNLEHDVRVGGFPPPQWLTRGEIAFISHSGSVFGAMAHNDERLRYNLVVSSGQELATTVADYLDFALDLESTRAVGLFLEGVRDAPAFVSALEKARSRDVPHRQARLHRGGRGPRPRRAAARRVVRRLLRQARAGGGRLGVG